MVHDPESWLISWRRRGFSTEAARLLRQQLLNYKAYLNGPVKVGRSGSSNRLNRRRYASRKVREARARILEGFPVRFARDLVAIRSPQDEPVLTALHPKRNEIWLPIEERAYRAETVDLMNFSFVDDPAGTMTTLQRIAELEAVVSEGRLNFNDHHCLDIGPYLVLQTMNRAMLPLYIGGKISTSVQGVLQAVGLRNALGMQFQSSRDDRTIWPLPFRTRHPQTSQLHNRLLRTQTSEQVATDIIGRLNDWLGQLASVELTRKGESLVLSMAGEAFNNAERHSDLATADGSWSVAGFMARRRDAQQQIYYRFHLALLSTGATIAESMQTAGAATLARMRSYVDSHRSLLRRDFTTENLETVFALQDGVSRMGDAIAQGRGGTGLMDIIEFFCALSGTSDPVRMQPKLALISGQTCILVKPPYIQGVRRTDSTAGRTLLAPREMWFNPSNTPEEPPDSENVLNLPAPLKGTLVTMAWTIDQKFLQSAAAEPTDASS